MDIKEYIKKLVQEILEEESASGDAGSYSTPFAFKKPKNELEETINNLVKEQLLKEGTYHQFKKDVKYRTKNEMLHKGIKQVKQKLQEVDKIIEHASRMRQELSEDAEGLKYWKATERNVGQISEMANSISNKIKNLYQ